MDYLILFCIWPIPFYLSLISYIISLIFYLLFYLSYLLSHLPYPVSLIPYPLTPILYILSPIPFDTYDTPFKYYTTLWSNKKERVSHRQTDIPTWAVLRVASQLKRCILLKYMFISPPFQIVEYFQGILKISWNLYWIKLT